MRKLNAYGPSLIVLTAAGLVLFAGPFAVKSLTYAQTQARIVQASQRLEDNNILEQINQAYRDIATFVEPSVVHISARQAVSDAWSNGRRQVLSTGSGWIWDAHGHIVTNNHVVEGAQRIEVQLDTGELREATIVGTDPSTDIAVLKIDPGRLTPAVRSGGDEMVNQGDMVFAFGSPFDFRFSMSSGVVSGIGRTVGVIRDQMGGGLGYENFIQVDAAINPGNSGGPLTNFRGHVIGMNTAIATSRPSPGDEGQFSGIGLAIPMHMIEPVVTQLIDTGVVQKGYLGVGPGRGISLQEVSRLAQDRGLIGGGAFIGLVEEGSPAEEAGLMPGDFVTAVNGRRIEHWQQLRSAISSLLPGVESELTVWRYDTESETAESLNLSVTLARYDTLRLLGVLPVDQDESAIPELGIAGMATNTHDLAADYRAEYVPGVMLTDIVPDSELADWGIEPGTVIVSVEGEAVRDTQSFIEALRQYNLQARAGVRTDVVLADGKPIRGLPLRVQR